MYTRIPNVYQHGHICQRTQTFLTNHLIQFHPPSLKSSWESSVGYAANLPSSPRDVRVDISCQTTPKSLVSRQFPSRTIPLLLFKHTQTIPLPSIFRAGQFPCCLNPRALTLFVMSCHHYGFGMFY